MLGSRAAGRLSGPCPLRVPLQTPIKLESPAHVDGCLPGGRIWSGRILAEACLGELDGVRYSDFSGVVGEKLRVGHRLVVQQLGGLHGAGRSEGGLDAGAIPSLGSARTSRPAPRRRAARPGCRCRRLCADCLPPGMDVSDACLCEMMYLAVCASMVPVLVEAGPSREREDTLVRPALGDDLNALNPSEPGSPGARQPRRHPCRRREVALGPANAIASRVGADGAAARAASHASAPAVSTSRHPSRTLDT